MSPSTGRPVFRPAKGDRVTAGLATSTARRHLRFFLPAGRARVESRVDATEEHLEVWAYDVVERPVSSSLEIRLLRSTRSIGRLGRPWGSGHGGDDATRLAKAVWVM